MLGPIIHRHPDPWPRLVEVIKQHAHDAYPKESCGIIVDDQYIRCENTHADPLNHFLIDPAITAPLIAAGTLQAVVHSHPNGPNHPTTDDVEGQIASDIPWGIVPVTGDEERGVALGVADILWWGDSLPPVPLERRRFVWGIFTCYQLFRDWWKQERGVDFPTWAMTPEFAKENQNIFHEYREKVGLTDIGKVDISDLQVGDMLVGRVRGEFPNHCGIFVGDDTLLHHPPSGLSTKAELLRWWPYVETVFRYEPTTNATSVRGTSKKVRKASPRRRRDVS